MVHYLFPCNFYTIIRLTYSLNVFTARFSSMVSKDLEPNRLIIGGKSEKE